MKLENADRKHIEKLRSQTRIKKAYIRYTILLLLDDGYSYHQVAMILGIDEKTVQRIVRIFENKGADGLTAFFYKGRIPLLTLAHQRKVKVELAKSFYKDTKEIQAYILASFKISMTRGAVTHLMKRLGFVYKKTKILPGKASGVDQQRFASKLKRMKARLSGDEAIYFMDGVHPTYNTRAAYGWIEKGKDYNMPSNTGRQRVNINGAMNGNDPTDILVDFTDMINAQSTIRLFSQIEERNPFKRRIFVIGDNARYYNSKLLKEWLKEHPKIIYVPLPPYSPNLNLIERLWGFMYRERINNFYFDTYDKFRKAVVDFFKHIGKYNAELNSLITWNFQIVHW